MLRPCKLLLLLAAIAHAFPTGSSDIVKRQFDGPKVVESTNTFDTPAGTVTETCRIILTPIRGNLVREEKRCTITFGNQTDTSVTGGLTSSISSTGLATSSAGVTSTGLTTSPADVTTTTSSITTSSIVTPPPPASTTVTTSSVAPPPPPPIASTSAVSVAPPPPASSAVAVNPVSSVNIIPVSSASSISVAPASAVSAAAEQASTSAAPFQIPGKKLEVLPIGLGVFAGISVIALIVVGLVTYERTKYRRAFRQRKLAETAEPMGYGGMAERA